MPEGLIGQKLLLAFQGKDRLPEDLRRSVRRFRPAGFTLFRGNLDSPVQAYQMTRALQQMAREEHLPPFLICADQEGGQLMAIGEGATLLPGNMALGAAGSAALAHQAGEVLGRELSAMGVNVNYAPCCDVNSNPHNPVVGTRSFGEDPGAVASLAGAIISGMQSCGVAATAKHFPGHGDTQVDSHHDTPSLPHTRQRLDRVELPPFAAAIRAGVKLVMAGHLALPAIEGREGLPATLSPVLLKGLLREEMGFQGAIITDAMDMAAIRQGGRLGEQAVRAAAAGNDLLLLKAEPSDYQEVYESLVRAARGAVSGKPALDAAGLRKSLQRVWALKQWLAAQPEPPGLEVVACAEHQAVAAEIAARSITLVRDQAGSLPLRPAGGGASKASASEGGRLAVILPRPADLTPADTSSYVRHTLADSLRAYNPGVDEFILSQNPSSGEIAALLERIRNEKPAYQALIVGTINVQAESPQANLVRAVLQTGPPAIVIALRLPYDLVSFPEAPAYLCTYSLLAPSMHALARVLFGQAAPHGRLPVSIPGHYPLGHGMTL
jgi:beta-N-acetylhexosaminidase